MQWFLQQHSLELGDEADVKTAAMLAKQMAYQNKVSKTPFLQMLPDQAVAQAAQKHGSAGNASDFGQDHGVSGGVTSVPCLMLS